MAWASSGGYTGVTGNSGNGLDVAGVSNMGGVRITPRNPLQVEASAGGALLQMSEGSNNDGLLLHVGVGLFGHLPPAAATAGGAHTAGGTYTAVEQGMLEAAYAALRSIGLVT